MTTNVVSFEQKRDEKTLREFDPIFQECLVLTEKAAAYLDNEGRAASKTLPSELQVIYATCSMKLTTTLLDLASWLLAWRALQEGNLDESYWRKKNAQIHTRAYRPELPVGMPEGFHALAQEVVIMSERVRLLRVSAERSMRST